MIIVDLNQVMISNLYMQLGNNTNANIEEPMFRHMVLNSLRSYKTKFSTDYGEMIIACDNKNYWRKQIFPYYKAHRKKIQEKSDINWKQVFEYIDKIKQELKDFFPYRVIDVESAEADDIIATLVMNTVLAEPLLILSADKDFVQLQYFKEVNQYDPIRKKFITEVNPIEYLFMHILKGDTGDGIPNVLSPDNCMVVGERQKPLTKKRIAEIRNGPVEGSVDHLPEQVRRNYFRNRQLIDLTMIPEDIKQKIMDQYIQQSGKKRDKLMNYFIANKLKNLFEHISEF